MGRQPAHYLCNVALDGGNFTDGSDPRRRKLSRIQAAERIVWPAPAQYLLYGSAAHLAVADRLGQQSVTLTGDAGHGETHQRLLH